MPGPEVTAQYEFLPWHNQLYIRYPLEWNQVDYRLDSAAVVEASLLEPVVKFWSIAAREPSDYRRSLYRVVQIKQEPATTEWTCSLRRR